MKDKTWKTKLESQNLKDESWKTKLERHNLKSEKVLKKKPLYANKGMKHCLPQGRKKQDRPRLKPKWKLVITKGWKTEDYLIVQGEWKAKRLPESSGFPWFIFIILFVLFLLVNTFFSILCRFTHIRSRL